MSAAGLQPWPGDTRRPGGRHRGRRGRAARRGRADHDDHGRADGRRVLRAARSRCRSGKPGDVIRAVPIAAPAGARAWRVLSHTRRRSRARSARAVERRDRARRPRAEARAASIVLVGARHDRARRPVRAVASDPSAALNLPWIDDLLAAGYVVAATDYQGLGTRACTRTWSARAKAGPCSTPRVRRASSRPARASASLLAGHSQGGHAALFAGEIAHEYAPELRRARRRAGAPVSDPGRFLDLTAASSDVRPASCSWA